MPHRPSHGFTLDAIDEALRRESDIEPSTHFTSRVMADVRHERALRQGLGFPRGRALVGLAIALVLSLVSAMPILSGTLLASVRAQGWLDPVVVVLMITVALSVMGALIPVHASEA